MNKDRTPIVPVVLFVFNRHKGLSKTLAGIRQNKVPLLYVFADGPRQKEDVSDVKKVRDIIDAIDWTKVVKVYNKKNAGLSKSIRNGMDQVFAKYEQAIVLEDDIYVSSGFYDYMTTCLETYKNVPEIAGVTGLRYPFSRKNLDSYGYDVFMTQRFSSWGWGTWKRTWKKLSFDTEWLVPRLRNANASFEAGGHDLPFAIDELISEKLTGCWDVYFYLNMLLNDQYFIWPKTNYVLNTGLTDGTHASGTEPNWTLKWELSPRENFKLPDKLELNDKIIKDFLSFFKQAHIYDLTLKQRLQQSFERVKKSPKAFGKDTAVSKIKSAIHKAINRVGYQINRIHRDDSLPEKPLREATTLSQQKPDPKNYSTTDGPMEVPCQKEAYYFALNNYIKPGAKVLDVGCGLGYGMAIMSVVADEVHGIDVDKKAVKYSSDELLSRNPKIKSIETYNGYRSSFKDNQFDVVTCVDVLEHVKDYDRFIDELLRISKGVVMISTPNRRPEFTNPDGSPKNYWHLREWDYKELDKILTGHSKKVGWHFINGPWDGPFKISDRPKKDTLVLLPTLRK